MNIFALQAPIMVTCPSWCSAHLPTDDSVVHISSEQSVALTGGPDRGEVYVSLEQVDDDPAAVRVQGAYDAPMTPVEALQLAGVIQAAAIASLVSLGARGGSR
jgi:hypothetical protein